MLAFCKIILFILINLQFTLYITGWCRTSNDWLSYTCVGPRPFYGFSQLSVNKPTREKIIRATFLDCQEINIPSTIFNFPVLKYLTISCGIQTVHENAFGNLNGLLELNLSYNAISDLPNDVFKEKTNLIKLNLTNNYIKQLTRNVFDGLNNLKQLYLSHNSISKFDIKTLDAVKNLEELYLNYNKIQVIPSRVFGKLTSLRVVDLSYNIIEELGNLFLVTHNLNHVNLSHNSIENLPGQIFSFSKLKVLDLSYNQLSVIYEDALKIDTLEELHLQHNKISLFEVKGIGLKKLPLSILDVRHNRLVFLEDGFITLATDLITFKVEDNPWDCVCFEKMERLHGDLELDLTSTYLNGDEPLCVISLSNDNVCNVDRNNLDHYYNVFKDQLDFKTL